MKAFFGVIFFLLTYLWTFLFIQFYPSTKPFFSDWLIPVFLSGYSISTGFYGFTLIRNRDLHTYCKILLISLNNLPIALLFIIIVSFGSSP